MKRIVLVLLGVLSLALSAPSLAQTEKGTRMRVKAGESIKMTGPDILVCPNQGQDLCRISGITVIDGGSSCTVNMPFIVVLVNKGETPRMKWQLDSSAHAKFRFSQTRGIDLDPANDPSQDLSDANPDGDDYKWENHNKRVRGISYKIIVERKSNGVACDELDPVIVNLGS